MAPQQENRPPHAMGGGAPQNRVPPNRTNHHSTHHRIQLKLIDHRTRTARDDVFRVAFGVLEAPLTRLNTTENGFYAIADDIRTIDKLLTHKAITELAKINL